jgi:hypothetical protein
MASRSARLLVLLAGLLGCGGRGLNGGGAGTTGASGDGAAGTAAAAGTSGAAGTTGAAGTNGAAGTTGASGTAGVPLPPLSGAIVEPTPGCGQELDDGKGAFARGTIQTMGVKPAGCADSKCGAWSYPREYYWHVPAAYDPMKAYPIVFEGPGCGGKGNNLYRNPQLDGIAIRVGLSPSSEAAAFHSTNPNQGCFDDRDGDASVDFVFYEALYDRLARQLCFDRNRVFAAGNSSGARLANEMGCKYAGDPLRPIRGVMTTSAGLPTTPRFTPTCTSKPLSGFWIHSPTNQTNPFTETRYALERAMKVNGCPAGLTYETAEFEPFPISTSDQTSCKRVKGCPDAPLPLVICPPPFSGQTSHDDIVVPGWLTFVKLFEPPP